MADSPKIGNLIAQWRRNEKPLDQLLAQCPHHLIEHFQKAIDELESQPSFSDSEKSTAEHLRKSRSDSEQLASLISIWNILKKLGTPGVAPEDICDDSELLDDFRKALSDSEPSTAAHRPNRIRCEDDDELKSGRIILDRYRLETCLGRGGFGEVWKAFDARLQKPVALKFPRVDRLSSEKHIELFLSEARKAASLRHRCIVTVHNVEKDARRWVIVSDFIDGSTVTQRLKANRPSIEQAANLIADIAEALHVAHKKKLVHRDVKPGNILVDDKWHPYLTDFGLALTENDQLESEGGIAGTLPYMSPEQIRGDNRYLDGRSDLYSLGVVLYELLAGERPVKGKHDSDYREQILNREPRPPRSINDSIPDELERICLKCLSKSITDRYRTALDLATDLRTWQQRQSQGDSRTSAIAKASKTPSKQNLTTWLGAIVAAVVVAAVVLIGLRDNQPEPNADPESSTNKKDVSPNPPAVLRYFEDLSPDEIQPHSVYSLLNREPKKLLWPLASNVALASHQPDSKQLSVNCQSLALLGLGKLTHADYSFRIDIHQNRWTGGVGVFFGYQEQEKDGKTHVRFQQIFLGKLSGFAAKKTPFQLQRVLQTGYKLPDGSLRGRSQPMCGKAISMLPYRPQQLEITVTHGRLQSVRFGGLELPEFCALEINQRFNANEYRGWFGTCNSLSESLYQNAQIQVFGKH